jgi:hypothetical protein
LNKDLKKEKLVKIMDLLKQIKNNFNLYNDIDFGLYIQSLLDLDLTRLENSILNLISSKNTQTFPTIYEIRKYVLEKESMILYEYLLKLSYMNINIEFENDKIKMFIENEGGWNNFKVNIKKIDIKDFNFKYINFKYILFFDTSSKVNLPSL